jgi:hypothetical protein
MRTAKKYPTVKTNFTFRTAGLKELWDKILTAQLKDGLYKDGWWGSHINEWAFYVQAKTDVGGETKLIGLPANVIKLTGFSRLIKLIGPEMVATVKVVEPNADIEIVRKYLQEIAKAIRDAETGKNSDIPEPLPLPNTPDKPVA